MIWNCPWLTAFAAALALMGCETGDPTDVGGENGEDPVASDGSTSGNGSSGDGSTGSGSNPAASCAGVVGEGSTVGDIADDWTLPDVYGEVFALYGLCGKVIFFESGSMW